MKVIIYLSALGAMITPVLAGDYYPPAPVPEMDAGAGIAAIALLAGAAAVIRERMKRK